MGFNSVFKGLSGRTPSGKGVHRTIELALVTHRVAKTSLDTDR